MQRSNDAWQKYYAARGRGFPGTCGGGALLRLTMKAALLALTLVGCANATSTGDVSMRVLTTGGYAAAQSESPRAIAVKTADEYRAAWQEQIGSGDAPQADFAKESVVLLLAGLRRSGGYSVEPRGVRIEGRTLVVDAEVKTPPPGSMTTQALTSPYAVIAVDTKSFDDVRWTP